jgi:hypothetical protein
MFAVDLALHLPLVLGVLEVADFGELAQRRAQRGGAAAHIGERYTQGFSLGLAATPHKTTRRKAPTLLLAWG